jgi:hypothetical protein
MSGAKRPFVVFVRDVIGSVQSLEEKLRPAVKEFGIRVRFMQRKSEYEALLKHVEDMVKVVVRVIEHPLAHGQDEALKLDFCYAKLPSKVQFHHEHLQGKMHERVRGERQRIEPQ